jgi:hypothetical protein
MPYMGAILPEQGVNSKIGIFLAIRSLQRIKIKFIVKLKFKFIQSRD